MALFLTRPGPLQPVVPVLLQGRRGGFHRVRPDPARDARGRRQVEGGARQQGHGAGRGAAAVLPTGQ